MDRFTRNYAITLGVCVAGAVLFWGLRHWDPQLSALNQLLAADTELAAYPYAFRVVNLDNGVATLSTPRSFERPAADFLAIIQPELAGKDSSDPAFFAAQARLAEHQKRAQALIEAQSAVRRVQWTLDQDWYARHDSPQR